MIKRFEGVSGRRLRVDALAAQKMVCGNRALAEELADRVRLRALKAGEALIEQDVDDNGRKVGKCGPGNLFGQGLGWHSLP